MWRYIGSSPAENGCIWLYLKGETRETITECRNDLHSR